ncbi:lipase class 3 [Paraphaeosphaeria minitans]|uniref:Lipase class 3 n=1 Tax=Paraphaeosphaeria minitans TaxID=565426 RepID=A0A9P6G6H7_9PLEO|nr:lipase class 3 [Paraphaeosphaeria minitans]
MNGGQSSQQPPHTHLASVSPACSSRPAPAHVVATENEISPAAWPLIHLAATCSEAAYNGVAVPLAISSVVLERITISQHRTSPQGRVTVIAVAGTRGLKDWRLNLKNSVSETVGVLGGPRNLCHTGFLEAVKTLISPLALSLSAVEKGSILLFTGHSAGAAIGSLLYAHVKSIKTSPLAVTATGFDTIHCIVFGAPPISTTPLPVHDDERSNHQGSLFLSLINDGDPIIKADMGYIAKKYRWLKPFRPHSLLIRRSWDNRAIESSSGVAAKPGSRLFANSGTLLSMRIESATAPKISIRITDNQELDEDRVTTWRVHGMKIYRKRIATLLAAGELIDYGCTDEKACSGHTTSRGNAHVEEVMLNGWIGLLLL